MKRQVIDTTASPNRRPDSSKLRLVFDRESSNSDMSRVDQLRAQPRAQPGQQLSEQALLQKRLALVEAELPTLIGRCIVMEHDLRQTTKTLSWLMALVVVSCISSGAALYLL